MASNEMATLNVDTLKRIKEEAERRSVRYSRPPVLQYLPTPDNHADPLAMPGSVTLFIAPRGSSVLDDIKYAATSKDGSDAKLVQRLRPLFESRQMVSLEEAADALANQPVFADLRYGGNPVAQNLFVPDDLPLAFVGCPYTGGRLASDAFTLVERYRDAEARLDAVVLVNAPPLTDAERAAVDNIPDDQTEVHVGSANLCFALCGVAVAYVVATAGIALTCGVPPERIANEPHVDEDLLEMLPPTATMGELLRMRRQFLARV